MSVIRQGQIRPPYVNRVAVGPFQLIEFVVVKLIEFARAIRVVTVPSCTRYQCMAYCLADVILSSTLN
jgi:hypothetical protein